MKKVKYYANEVRVFADLLRRFVCFHENESMYDINLWGLDNYGIMNSLRKKGYVISEYKKENKICWFHPTKMIIDEIIKPAYELYNNDTRIYVKDKFNVNYEEYIYKIMNYSL